MEKKKKELILESAKKMFTRYGFEKTSINDIAKNAKIGKGTIYYYFNAKEDIYLDLLTQEVDLMIESIMHIFKENCPAVEKFKKIVLQPLVFLKSECVLITQKWNKEYKFDLEKINCHKNEVSNRMRKIMVEAAGLLKKDGILKDSISVEFVAQFIVNWIYQLEGAQEDDWHEDEKVQKWIDSVDKIIDIMLYGIVKKEVS